MHALTPKSGLALVSVLACLCACGDPKSNDASSTSTETAGTETAGTETAGTDDSDSDTSDADACEDYARTEADFGPAVAVTITNARPDIIYVKTSPYDDGPPFTVTDADGPQTWTPDYDCQSVSCAQMISGICEEACPGCVCGEAILLAPGASYEITWPGALYESAELPAECNAEACSLMTCAQPHQAPDGVYTLDSIAYTEFVCDEQPCECSPGELSCILETSNPDAFSGEQLQAQVQLAYPNELSADVTFE